MRIVVNDANVLIDLVELKILPHFFLLEYDFHTTEMILAELFSEQKEALNPYIEMGKLVVDGISEIDLLEILNYQRQQPNLSEQDCSALHQAKKTESMLITSDNLLRKYATTLDVEVHGHLWVFDNLVGSGILPGNIAIKKLDELCSCINPKLGLPSFECNKRRKIWSEFV